MYISSVAEARLFTAVFSQLSIFTADCLRHPIHMAGVETMRELHTLPVINSWFHLLLSWTDITKKDTQDLFSHDSDRRPSPPYLYTASNLEAVKV